jgi:hypothetical protein
MLLKSWINICRRLRKLTAIGNLRPWDQKSNKDRVNRKSESGSAMNEFQIYLCVLRIASIALRIFSFFKKIGRNPEIGLSLLVPKNRNNVPTFACV